EILERNIEDISDTARQRLEEPDMRHRRGELDMCEPLTTHLGRDHFHTAFFARGATVFHAFIFTAEAFIVLYGAKDLGAEQPITFRTVRSVVNGFGLFHLTVAPLPNLLRRSEADLHRVKRFHTGFTLKNAEDIL